MPITCVNKQLKDNAFVGSVIRHKLVAHVNKIYLLSINYEKKNNYSSKKICTNI